jgi:5-methylcytosine-specific restriction endonuclease McrA
MPQKEFWEGFEDFRANYFREYRQANGVDHPCQKYHFSKPRSENWCNVTRVNYIPKPNNGYSLNMMTGNGWLVCQLYISNNHDLFNRLKNHASIDERLKSVVKPNVRIEWTGPHGNVKATYIRAIWEVGRDEVIKRSQWEAYYKWLIYHLEQFDVVFRDVFKKASEDAYANPLAVESSHTTDESLSSSENPTLSGDEKSRFEEDFKKAVQEARKASKEARQERLRNAPRKPNQRSVTTTVFDRNPDVVAEVLERANGFCENEKCGKKAPFLRVSDNSPYLEVHHRIPLAQGGDDTVENATALCPNCHREAHFG